jgi:predicted TIM-barrel fold metal-dependent hydrolase
MRAHRGFISVDDHVIEPPDLWTRRLSKAKWGDRIPRVERRMDGSDHWVVDGRDLPLHAVAEIGATLPDRAAAPMTWADVPDTAHSAGERLKAMDTDGVDYSVLYPMISGVAGQTFGHLADADLELACVQAYNDWLIEEWAVASPRFIPQCIVPLYPVQSSVKEITRAVAKGHKGVVFPAIPQHLRNGLPHIYDREYDPVWQTCEDLGVPVCFHSGSSPELQLQPYEGFSPATAAAFRSITRPASNSTIVGNMLMSRAIIDHPNLKVVFAESGLGWIVFSLEMADHQFERVGLRGIGYKHLPSDLFRRQCYLTGWYDDASLHHALRHIGADSILWSTNFPLATSSWPNSQDVIAKNFNTVPKDDADRILWGNAGKLYGIEQSAFIQSGANLKELSRA